jgi:type I restriction enzyme S subunit
MMELKAGYKQTDVGVIPEDWEVKPLGDFSNVALLIM